MPLSEFFRKLFRRSEDQPKVDSFDITPNRPGFRDPIWKTSDDDYDDDEIYSDFRNPQMGPQFNIFSDPVEMTRYFESQMDNMLKIFSSQFGLFSLPPFNEGDSMGALPFDESPNSLFSNEPSDLRKKMLKPGYENNTVDTIVESTPKVDTDLDGNITTDDFSRIWGEHKSTKEVKPIVPQYHSFGKSVVSQFVRRPDGSIEHKRTLKDNQGNEETIVTRQIGDKKYVITTKRDKNGEVTKTEDLINMDENELQNFNQNWLPSTSQNQHPTSIFDHYLWSKFFGPNPKL